MKSKYGLDLKKTTEVGGGKKKQTGNKFGDLLVFLKILAFPDDPNNGSSDVVEDTESPLGSICSILQCLILVAC